jgi:hypothetical protein
VDHQFRREMEVRAMFEPDRFTRQNLAMTYERIVAIKRRSTRANRENQKANEGKGDGRAGGAR